MTQAARDDSKAALDREVIETLAAKRSIIARLLAQLEAIRVDQTIEQIAADLAKGGRPR
jgi:hypothetical protein